MPKNDRIRMLNTEATVVQRNSDSDCISMTNIANFKNVDYPSEIIQTKIYICK